MAESESLDAVLLHQQDDELKQLHGDEGDKSSGGGVKDFKPVVERDEKEEGEEGGEDDGAGDGEGGEDETRTVVSETEEGAVSLSSMPEEKWRNLGAAEAAKTVPENDRCIGSAGNSAPEALTEAEIKERVGSSQGGISECGSPREAKAETNLRLQLCVSPASATELSPTSVTQPISAAPSPAVPEQRLPSSKGTGAPLHGADQPKASELSPTSVTQPISAAPSPTVPEQKLPSSKGTGATLHEADQPKASDTRKLVIPVLKTAIPDGYNWRKYGQKQVKSPTGSRSYYRCTHSDCVAKKIECSDHCGRVVDVVNKGMHSHDPPRKSSSKRVSRIAAPCGRVSGDVVAEHASRLTESDPATPSKEPRDEKFVIADRKRSSPSGSGENAADQIKQEHACVPEPKKRAKKDNLDCSGALTKPGKKPKFVVHAADDVGISGDGYRWRKYGQKMVKGNTHPRNYYRCTSAGCPVRKHIESAADNSSAVIITYKGVHDHDMPVPKKRQRPPSAPLVAAAAAAAASVNNALQQQQNKSSEPALRDTNDKPPAESAARALVSIGFEIKPC